jgi:putative hydrolase of the HAD superfamily
MLRGILFDMGGTLDGDGHWLDRFVLLYAEHGLAWPRDAIRRGFDYAEQCAAADAGVMTAGLDALVRRHLAWQFEAHRLDDPRLLDDIAARFIGDARAAARRTAPVLADLHARGYRLGVVSNACGNAEALCDDLGYTRDLDTVIDSRRVGVAKPDPAIFERALDRLGLPAAAVMMVGDSYARDIVPAHAIGMRTAWFVDRADRARPGVADLCVDSLAALAPWLTAAEQASA